MGSVFPLTGYELRLSKRVNFPGFLASLAKTVCVRAEHKGLKFRYQPLGDLQRVGRGTENRIRQI
jgi:hypothetical protein